MQPPGGPLHSAEALSMLASTNVKDVHFTSALVINPVKHVMTLPLQTLWKPWIGCHL